MNGLRPRPNLQRFPLRWSASKLEQLNSRANDPSACPHPVDHMLAPALLHAAAGDFDTAEAIAFSALARFSENGVIQTGAFVAILEAFFAVQQLDIAASLLRDRFNLSCAIHMLLPEVGPGHGRFVWDVELPKRMTLTFDRTIVERDQISAQVVWLYWIFPLLATYTKYAPVSHGSVIVNQWDCGLSPGLAMCDNRPEYFLIPCNAFLRTHGYESIRNHYDSHDIPWSVRKPVAFWRGATTGQAVDPSLGWRSLQRIKLCEIGRAHPDMIDARISNVAQITDSAAHKEIVESGLMGNFVPDTDFNRYRYQIDIDGNTNSWPGLFQKLLTGSPVLKVASPFGYRQWYYDRLRPWVNFVPISADMTELPETIQWLMAHDNVAQSIGMRGRMLAKSLSYEDELKRACDTIAAAFRHFAGQPELDVSFGTGMNGNEFLGLGWYPPEEGGVAARGYCSRVQIPRPCSEMDYLLSVDIAPSSELLESKIQNVRIALNGEVLLQETLTERTTLECPFSRRLVADCDDSITIDIFHPDREPVASILRPLDERVASIRLHAVKLTALAPRGVLDPAAREGGLDGKAGQQEQLHRILTHHNTMLYLSVPSYDLRHGPRDTSPENVFLIAADGKAHMVYRSDDGAIVPLRVPLSGRGASTMRSHQRQLFSVVANNPPTSFGLRYKEMFLCAEPDGRVTLSRPNLSLWESFRAEHIGITPGAQRQGSSTTPPPPVWRPYSLQTSAVSVSFANIRDTSTFSETDPTRVEGASLLRKTTNMVPLMNVALGKPSTQSSDEGCRDSAKPEGGNATSGVKTGGYGFHTRREANPWWLLDLQRVYRLRRIIVYNRELACADRADEMSISVSSELQGPWIEIQKTSGRFGGVLTDTPLDVELPAAVPARFVQLQLNNTDFFHLDEVEVYAEPDSNDPKAAIAEATLESHASIADGNKGKRSHLVNTDDWNWAAFQARYHVDLPVLRREWYGPKPQFRIDLSTPFDGKIDALRVQATGGFGNFFYDILNASMIARAIKCSALEVPEVEGGTEYLPVLVDDMYLLPPETTGRGLSTLSACFYWPRGFEELLGRYSSQFALDTVNRFVRPVYHALLNGARALESNVLMLHFRGGDNFATTSPHPGYVQPPTSYYLAAIDFARAELGVTAAHIVFQDRTNPSIEMVMEHLRGCGVPFTFQSSSVSADISALLSARHIVAGYGTFCEAIGLLSENLRTYIGFRALSTQTPIKYWGQSRVEDILQAKGVRTFVIDDMDKSYIHPGTWSNSKEQIEMMQTFPASKLRLQEHLAPAEWAGNEPHAGPVCVELTSAK